MRIMKICVIDPASHIPSLKILFPEAEYFAHEPDSFFTYISTSHYTKQQIRNEYGFEYRTDWSSVTSNNFDVLFIVAPFIDYFNVITTTLTPHVDRMLDTLQNIIKSNTFKKIVLFDVHDYDYDPNEVNKGLHVDLYFKRNYDTTKKYMPNVFPFPCMMFVKPCVLSLLLYTTIDYRAPRINAPMWAGAVYNHIDTNFTPVKRRMRKDMFDQIQHTLIVYSGLPHSKYMEKIRSHTILVDLLGVGDPNKRIFEGFSNGTLVMTMTCDLNWGFSNGDDFHPDTKFRTAEEYFVKLDRLLLDYDHYAKCLEIQNNLVNKYFTKEALSTYILTCIRSI
jgi:hypothetical protein